MKTYLAELKHGRFILLKYDFICDMANLYGEWSEKETELFRAILSPGATVIEAGAHIGLHTVPLGQIVGPEGIVLSLEPQRALYRVLNGNIALNNLLNVWPFLLAAGATTGRAAIPEPTYETSTNYGNLTARADTEGNVPLVPIDHLAGRLDRPVQLIKIDVEAAGVETLLGSRAIITRDRPLLFVEYFEGNDQIIQTVRELGYVPFWFCVPGYSPDNYRSIRQNIFKEDGKLLGDFNLLCIPQDHSMPGFLQEAVSGQDLEDRKVAWVTDKIERWW